MRVIVQRALEAKCEVDGKTTGKIDKGLINKKQKKYYDCNSWNIGRCNLECTQ